MKNFPNSNLVSSIENQILTMQYFSISNKSQLPVIDGIDNIIIWLWESITILHRVNSFRNFLIIVIDSTPINKYCQQVY